MIAARGVHHLAIQVRDLATVERFYGGALGLKVLRRWPAEKSDGGGAGPSGGGAGTGDRSVWLDTGDGSFLALEVVAAGPTAAEDPARGERPGLHLVALRIAAGERSQWQERLAQAGVEIYHRTPYTLYVRDPEGNRVGLSHHPDGEAAAGPG